MTASTDRDQLSLQSEKRVVRSFSHLSPQLALVLLWGFLVSPVALIPLFARDQYPLDDLYLFTVLASAFWCGLLISLFARPIVFHLIAIPLYLATCIDLFLIFNFGTRLSSSYIGVILSDSSEASEFIATYTFAIVAQLFFLIVVVPFLIFRTRSFRLKRVYWGRAIGFAVLLLGLYALGAARTIRNGGDLAQSINAVAAKETSAPIGVLAQTYAALKQASESAEFVRSRSQSQLLMSRAAPTGAEVYVWVVGESSRPQNWGLYGYAKDTTPLLKMQEGLVILSDVVTTAPLTSVAVPSMLSLQPISDWEAILREKSIIGAFKSAGFETAWLSTQEADGWAGIIPQIANEADQTRFFDHAHDGVMLESIRKLLNSVRYGEKLFIVVHTKGSHFEYSRRYPSEFAKFGGSNPSLIDEYDNSIVYTDWFLSSVIHMLSAHTYSSALIYVSDHGENLRDDARKLLGHSIGNEFDLRVPTIFWFSKEFADAHQQLLCNGQRNARSRLSMSDLSHSFLDIVGMRSPLIDKNRSIFDPTFREHPRQFILNGRLDTYSEQLADRRVRVATECE